MKHVFAVCCIAILAGLSATAQNPIRKLSQHLLPKQPVYDVWGYTDEATGREYALCGSGGVVIFDVTDPENPELVANLESEADFDVKVWKHYAYAVTGGSGQGDIIDLSDPTHPQVIGHFPSSHNLFIDDNGYMYASFPALIMYDLNPDPENPTEVWVDHTGGGGHDVMVKNGRLYDFHGYEGTFIYELNDQTSPTLVAHIDDPAIRYNHGGDVTEDGNILYICDELALGQRADVSTWDISDLGNISRIGHIVDSTATMHNFYIIGDYAYTSYYSAGLRIYDITNPYSLELVTEYDTSPHEREGYLGAFGIYPWAGLDRILITDRDSGLMIFSTEPKVLDDQVIVNDMEGAGMVIYPNPSAGSFHVVAAAEGMREAELTLYDVAGRLISYQQASGLPQFASTTFYVDGLPAGIYVVVVEADTGRQTARVVVD